MSNKEQLASDAGTTPTGTPQTEFGVLKRRAIVRSKTNPRKRFDPAYLAELGKDIKAKGFAQAVLVRPLPPERMQESFEDRQPGDPLPTHELVCGECRHRSAELEDIEDMPVMIRRLSDLQAFELQLTENLKRKDLHPLEEAEAFQELIDKHGLSVVDIAAKFEVSTAQIYVTLKLLELTPECRTELYAGKLTRSTALLVARSPAHLQAQIAKDIMRAGVDGEPMTYRAAVRHIHDRYMLQLSAAPFDIKDATLVPKAGACPACPKRTGSNKDLFEDVKSADTCTDPKCFDQKKVAHVERVAKAAAAKGQTVIMGKEAKELIPNDYSLPKGYKLLDDKEYIDGKYTSVRSAIGKENLPTPVLIVHPHTNKLVEALPVDQASKLLASAKRKKTADKAPNERELKTQYDQGWHQRTLTAMHQALMAGKMQAMGVDVARHIAIRYLHDCADHDDHIAKLFNVPKVAQKDGIGEFIKTCPAQHVAPLLLLLMVADELENESYAQKPKFPIAELIAGELGVDIASVQKAVQEEMRQAAEARKQEAAAKKAKPPQVKRSAASAAAAAAPGSTAAKKTPVTPKGTVGKKGQPDFMQPLQPSAELAVIVGNKPLPRTEIVSRIWAYIKKKDLQDKVNKRIVRTDDAMKAVFDNKAELSMFELAGLFGKHVTPVSGAPGAKKAPKKLSAADAKAGISKALQAQAKAPAAAPAPKSTIDPKSAWPFPTAPKGAGA